MSYGVIESLEAQRAIYCSSNLLDWMTSYIYRTSTHKIDTNPGFSLRRKLVLSSLFNRLDGVFNPFSKAFSEGTSTHKLDVLYRTFTHIFTVLSPTFLSKKPNSLSYNTYTQQELHQLKPVTYKRTTGLLPIKLPLFHTYTYRSFTQGSTALSNINFAYITVLSTMKSVSNLLIRFINSIRKVDLKLVHKKIISLVDVLFFEFGRGRKQI